MLKLYELATEFEDLDDQERLQVLLDFAETLPPASAGEAELFGNEGCRVQECQTPVYLRVRLIEGQASLEADVPRKSPTVRGLVSVLVEGLDGEDPQEILALPDDVMPLLHLDAALGMTRQNGVRGMIARIKRDFEELLAKSAP